MIAALYVAEGGCYFGLPDVDPWPQSRDARLYAGPHPVVCHPPCERWGRFAEGGPTAPWTKKRGDDGGCFAAALASVRRWGGVLEHPADSSAWTVFGLHRPPVSGGWVVADDVGGWTCRVDQGAYGHTSRKATWLYSVGCAIPSLNWARANRRERYAHLPPGPERRRLQRAGPLAWDSHKQRAATPLPFRDLLLSIARSAHSRRGAA